MNILKCHFCHFIDGIRIIPMPSTHPSAAPTTFYVVRVRKMKEPGSYAEAKAVEQDGWAAEDSDEETERN